MKLADLDHRKGQYKVFLLQTPSDKLKLFLYDKLKATYRCNQDTIFEVKDKASMHQIKEIAYFDSFISDKWLVTVDLSSKNANSLLKDLLPLMYESSSTIFFCTVNNYRSYKMVLDALKKKGITEVVSFYLTRLNSNDFMYLYNQHVTSSNKLEKTLYNAVYQGYNSNVSALMDFFSELKQGVVFESQKEVADVCGVGNNSVENFVFSLLKEPSFSETGTKTVLRNRLKAGFDLASIYGFPKFQSYMKNSLSCIRDIKVLKISGAIYKTLINLPEGYDEAKLSRYQRYLWRINTIPLSRVLRLGTFLEMRKWKSDLDFIHFLYTFLMDEMKYEVMSKHDKEAIEKEARALEEKEKKKEQERQYREQVAETKLRVEYIKKYGLIEGKRLFEEDKTKGLLDLSVDEVKPKKTAKSSSASKSKSDTANVVGSDAAKAFLTWISSDK